MNLYMLDITCVIYMYQLIYIDLYFHSFNTYLLSVRAASRSWGHQGA